MDLAARLSLHAGTRPDATALIEADSGRSWSWAELDGRITASTVALRRAGLVPGARVLVGVEHRLETVAWLLACWRCGGVVVPVSPGLPPRERAFFTEHSGAGLSVSGFTLFLHGFVVAPKLLSRAIPLRLAKQPTKVRLDYFRTHLSLPSANEMESEPCIPFG